MVKSKSPTGHRVDIDALANERGLRAADIDWERLLTVNYRRYLSPGGVVIDAGAHNGMHARRFRRYVRPAQLILVEPIPALAEGLRREFGRHRDVTVREVALSTDPGSATFVVNESSPGESGLRNRHANDVSHPTHEIDVWLERLDDWVIDAPVDFIKIDVEGGELDVLRGASELIDRDRPLISIEFGPKTAAVYGHTTADLLAFLNDHELAIVDLLGNELPAADPDSWAGVYYWDFILMPREVLLSTAETRRSINTVAFHNIDTFNPTVERWKKRLRR